MAVPEGEWVVMCVVVPGRCEIWECVWGRDGSAIVVVGRWAVGDERDGRRERDRDGRRREREEEDLHHSRRFVYLLYTLGTAVHINPAAYNYGTGVGESGSEGDLLLAGRL